MTSTDLLGRRDRVFADSADLTWLAGLIIVAAITFNALLCFVNTHVTPINNAYVVGAEALILTITFLACYRIIDQKYAMIITAIIVYTTVLALLRAVISPDEGMNLKIVRDFLIPVTFLLLGKGSSIKVADRIVYVATAIILFFALFEFFFLDAYLKVFSITEYYVARGTLDASDPSLQWAQGLMLSGMRPPEQGRELLSFLGGHRVSSLFLEPISLGKPFKLGSTIPVKFRLTDAQGNYVSTAVAAITVQQFSGDDPVGDPIILSANGADTGNVFRYDATDNLYIFNLGTKDLVQGTWQIRAALDDGTVKSVFIQLKRN